MQKLSALNKKITLRNPRVILILKQNVVLQYFFNCYKAVANYIISCCPSNFGDRL